MQHHSRIARHATVQHAVKTSTLSRLRVGLGLGLALNAVLLAGCGGGGGTSRAAGKTPTKAVKAHIRLLQTQSLRALAQSGVANSTLTAIRGGYGVVGAGGVAAGNGTADSAAPTASASANTAPLVPLTGQFLHNVAATSQANRAVAIRRMQARHAGLVGRKVTLRGRDATEGAPPPVPVFGSGSSAGSDAPDPGPPPTFYYDDYLGLWVDITDTPTSSTFALYQDEAKTQPAGSITSTFPTDSVFPQTYSSTYTYTAGSQAGSHGTYTSVYNQDGSGSSSYLDVYTDGGKDQGSSSQTAAGDYTWTNRTDNADKSYASASGTFHADGSGATHSSGSDGYVYDVTYRTDGSGHGRVTGPDPGLPATIDWDVQGNTTIVYADGSSEYTPGWGYGDVTPVDGSVTTTSTTVNSATTVSPSDTPPAPPVFRSARKFGR